MSSYSCQLIRLACLFTLSAFSILGCTPTVSETDGGTAAHYINPGQQSAASGVGIESQDIIAMTNKVIRDLLATPIFGQSTLIPTIIIDAEYFKNEGSSRINKNMITDRLRTELSRSSQGKMVFVGREYLPMVLQEKELSQLGITNQSETTTGSLALAADYRLGGRIATLDSVNQETGTISRFHQILFEMVELKDSRIVWSGTYCFKKSAQEDIIYR